MVKNRQLFKINTKWFYVVVLAIVVKVILMGLFSSDYQQIMFMPFVSAFIDKGVNPYTYYYENQLLYSFPYPPLMLLIESNGYLLVRLTGAANPVVVNILFKLPSLMFDCMMLLYLKRICSGDEKRPYLAVLYFCSPIVIYAVYMHGQLDLIPITLLVVSMYYLMRNKGKDWILFSVYLAAAVSCKLHVIAVVPLLIWYYYSRNGFRKMCASCAVIAGTVALVFLPFWGEGFLNLVLLNREQGVLTNVSVNYGAAFLYVPIFIIAVIYYKVWQLNHISSDLLICFTGILMGAFLCLTPAMPGWFVWIVPFLVVYFDKVEEKKHKIMVIYAALCVFYCVYYLFFHNVGYVDLYLMGKDLTDLKIENALMISIGFTLLMATLFTLVISMYQFGITENSIYKRGGLPFVIGIAGDSGTGKSEMLRRMEDLLTKRRTLFIEGDGDHRWERGNSNWAEITHLNPKANYLYSQARNLAVLRQGNSVRRQDYDHDTGKFTEKKRIFAKPYIIMCGLHALYLPQMRESIDLKIYMDTDENLRRFWKIRRDVSQRGYDPEKIVRQIESRMPDAEKYIYPQKKYADILVQMYDEELLDVADVSYREQISLKLTFPTGLDLEAIIDQFALEGVVIRHEYSDDLQSQCMYISASSMEGTEIDYDAMANANIRYFSEIFSHEIEWDRGMEGLIQFWIAYAICMKVVGEF